MPGPEIDPVVWAALNRLLDEALDLPAAERERWLEALPAEHAALKPRLRALLAHQAPAEAGPLQTLPKLQLTASEADAHEAVVPAGGSVGPYRLLRLLAEGGMGAVYLAERADGMLSRPVALKLPHGAWARPGLAERMAREREILGSLNHPHIARLYDAGLASDGQPYLALEYVEGRPIDAYAREQRLDLRSRLGLFLQVAQAVAHAHARLVVHRDLKPSNVLVTAEGQARLLDFGIAKLLEQGQARETELTRLSGRALTLAYASPEQIEGAPLSVASDVYSLGVVLYELLSEARPHRPARDSPGALEEAILRADPHRPSDVAKQPRFARALRGDLDTIVLKALKKDPEERYATVNAFAEDVERYLRGRPVLAQPDRSWYRFRRFVARNRLGVAAGTAVVLAILGGAGVAFWQARVALAEKRRAEEVKEFVISIFRDANPYGGSGQVPSAADLLKQARERIDRLETRPELRVELLNVVAASLLSLQETAAAEPVVAQALAEGRASLGPLHPQTLRAGVLSSQVHRFRGRTREMREELDRLLPALRDNPDALPQDLVYVLKQRAHLAIDDGRYPDAVAAAKQALAVALARLGDRNTDTVAAAITLATAYQYTKQPALGLEAARDAYRRALDVHQGQAKHPRVIEARQVYGRALAEVGQPEPAVEQLTRAVQDASEVFGPASLMVGFFSQNLVPLLLEVGANAQALETGDRAVAILSQHADPGSYTLAAAIGHRGLARLASRRAGAALEDLTRAQEAFGRSLGPEHARTISTRVQRALALAYLGRTAEAAQDIAGALERQRASGDPSVPVSLHVLGVVERLAGNPEQALRAQREALAAIPAGPRSERQRMAVRLEAGIDQLDLGHEAQALPDLEQALALTRRLQRRATPLRADALVGLGRARLGLGQPAQAAPFLEEAAGFWHEADAGSRWAGEATLWLGRCYGMLDRSAEAGPALARARAILSRSPIPADARLVGLASLR